MNYFKSYKIGPRKIFDAVVNEFYVIDIPKEEENYNAIIDMFDKNKIRNFFKSGEYDEDGKTWCRYKVELDK